MRRVWRRLMMQDYYKILELTRDAEPGEIRASWKRMAFAWHPDRNAHQAQHAARKFVDVAEAYQVLSNLVERARYDRLHPRAGLGLQSGAPSGFDSPSDGGRANKEEGAASGTPSGPADRGFTPTLWEETEEEAEARQTGPSLREYRAAVNDLARELADADPKGRKLDRMRGALGVILLIAAGLLVGPPWWSASQDPARAPLWVPLLLGLSALVTLVWTWSLRMQRRERLRPYAEAVLERTGRGWKGPPGGRGATRG